MSNLRRRIAPSVPFTLDVENEDGTKFSVSVRLAYDLNAIALAEQQLEHERRARVNLLGEIQQIMQTPAVRETTILFWAALQLYNEGWDGQQGLEAVRSIVTLPNLLSVHLKVAEAFLTQLPKEQGDKIRTKMRDLGEGDSKPPLAPTNPPAPAA